MIMPVPASLQVTSPQYSFQGYDVKDVFNLLDSLPPHVLEPHQSHPRGIGTYCRRDPKNNRIIIWISPGGRNRELVNMVLFEGWRIVLCVPADSWDAKTLTAEDVRKAAKDFVKWEVMGTEFGAVMVQPKEKVPAVKSSPSSSEPLPASEKSINKRRTRRESKSHTGVESITVSHSQPQKKRRSWMTLFSIRTTKLSMD